jgi:hypothetical protein
MEVAQDLGLMMGFVLAALITPLHRQGKIVPVLFFNWAQHHKAWWGNVSIAPHIFDLCTRCRWVVSFTPRPLYPQGKSPCYPLDRRLSGSQSRSGCGGEKKNSQPLPGLKSPIIQPISQRYTTELSRLLLVLYVLAFINEKLLLVYLHGTCKLYCYKATNGRYSSYSSFQTSHRIRPEGLVLVMVMSCAFWSCDAILSVKLGLSH